MHGRLEGLRQKQAELAGETYKDQLSEFLDAKKSEIEALLDRIDGGSGNFGSVNTQGIFGDTDKAVKSSRNFEVSAKILADAIRRGDASEEVLARGLQGLQNTINVTAIVWRKTTTSRACRRWWISWRKWPARALARRSALNLRRLFKGFWAESQRRAAGAVDGLDAQAHAMPHGWVILSAGRWRKTKRSRWAR